jgi:hypothetical protein
MLKSISNNLLPNNNNNNVSGKLIIRNLIKYHSNNIDDNLNKFHKQS